MNEREGGLYHEGIKRSGRISLLEDRNLLPSQGDILFAMSCNGFFSTSGGGWCFSYPSLKPYLQEFEGQKISFNGPNEENSYYSDNNIGPHKMLTALSTDSVTTMIRKYRGIDVDLAARIAFVLGGIVRYRAEKASSWEDVRQKVVDNVASVARMCMLGDMKSGDALASAMAMYALSTEAVDEDSQFKSEVFRMAEAVSFDPIQPQQTRDLGLSQVVRLHAFINNQGKPLSNLPQYIKALEDFPTVGAEFHFPFNASSRYPRFWQRLALLNMSQYQRGSYIQLSRNDRGIIEVRMNPSVYPVAIGTWNHMRLLLPELNETFFTATFNRRVSQDFNWDSDRALLEKLRAVGMLSYASIFSGVPQRGQKEEIDFGSVYLGQTVKLFDGNFTFSGFWGDGEGTKGQLGIYAGFGRNFPQLAYNLSMALQEPGILRGVNKDILSQTKTLEGALSVSPREIMCFFQSIRRQINPDSQLNLAYESGNKIMELLYP